jgi:hypothetical protein
MWKKINKKPNIKLRKIVEKLEQSSLKNPENLIEVITSPFYRVVVRTRDINEKDKFFLELLENVSDFKLTVYENNKETLVFLKKNELDGIINSIGKIMLDRMTGIKKGSPKENR